MPWPAKVLRQFENIPPNPEEREFHGPYNKLLYTLFGADEFTVVPRYETQESTNNRPFTYTVEINSHPVLVIVLRRPADLKWATEREKADLQVRDLLRDLRGESPMPNLHVVSCFGTRLCFYKAKSRSRDAVVPNAAPRDPQFTNDVTPMDWWDCDILEPEGEQRLLEVYEEIKSECEKLPQ